MLPDGPLCEGRWARKRENASQAWACFRSAAEGSVQRKTRLRSSQAHLATYSPSYHRACVDEQ